MGELEGTVWRGAIKLRFKTINGRKFFDAAFFQRGFLSFFLFKQAIPNLVLLTVSHKWWLIIVSPALTLSNLIVLELVFHLQEAKKRKLKKFSFRLFFIFCSTLSNFDFEALLKISNSIRFSISCWVSLNVGYSLLLQFISNQID